MRWRIPFVSVIAAAVVSLSVSVAVAQDDGSEQKSSSDEATESTADAEGDGESGGAATDGEGEDSEERESEHGSYQWKRSYGAGLEYGLFFNGLDRWNENLLRPNGAPEFETDALSAFTFFAEASLLEGTRLSVFGGVEKPFSDNPSITAVYGGVEPAFAFRRNFWEIALGLGVGFGNVSLETNDGREFSSNLAILRPTIEVRRYVNELVAGYLRFGFNQWLPFGADPDPLQIAVEPEQPTDAESLIQEGGFYAALGVRFGRYPEHVKTVPDSDGDGLRDDVDDCPQEPEDEDGFEDDDGCPDTDNDGDGVADADDECPREAEDPDGFEDEDGCPDPDNDGDEIADEDDGCPDEAEDVDGFEDEDGCPDPDNDGDQIADQDDECPDELGIPSNDGCPSEIVRVEGDRLVVDADIGFEAASGDADPPEGAARTRLTSPSEETLDTVAEVLSVRTELATVEILARKGAGEGDGSDGDGDESQKRAEAVRSYLVDAGVSASRLTATGAGVVEEKGAAGVDFQIRERTNPEADEDSDSSEDASGDDR